jgi:hypothetical protein
LEVTASGVFLLPHAAECRARKQGPRAALHRLVHSGIFVRRPLKKSDRLRLGFLADLFVADSSPNPPIRLRIRASTSTKKPSLAFEALSQRPPRIAAWRPRRAAFQEKPNGQP